MKFAFILLIAIIISSSQAESQLIKSFGAKIGMSSAKQDWNYSPLASASARSTYRLGFDAGVFLEWFTMPYLSILTEAHYIQKGSFVTASNIMGQLEVRANYFSYQLMAKVRTELGPLTAFIILGPRFEYLYSYYTSVYFGEYNTSEFGGTFGFGVESSVLCHIGVEFRYSPSFRDFFSNKYITIKNRSMEVLLTIGI